MIALNKTRPLKKITIYLIRFYQKAISPLLGANCRYNPTCSEYCIECFEKYNFFKAIYLSCKRIIRCHPFSDSGYDPVP